MKKHYVTFYSPGTFMAEDTTKEISSWDIEKAKKMAKAITERYNAIPYGFQFSTRERGKNDFDSKLSKRSQMYYLPHCIIRTISDVRKDAKPDEKILLSNMECNGWDKIVQTNKGWKWTQPLEKNDVVLK